MNIYPELQGLGFDGLAGSQRRLSLGLCFGSSAFVSIIHRGSGVLGFPAPDHLMLSFRTLKPTSPLTHDVRDALKTLSVALLGRFRGRSRLLWFGRRLRVQVMRCLEQGDRVGSCVSWRRQ